MQGKCKKALKSFQRTLIQVPLLVSFYVYVLFIFPTVFGNTLQTCATFLHVFSSNGGFLMLNSTIVKSGS